MASRLLPGNIIRKVGAKTPPVSIPKSKLLAPDSSGLIADGTSRLGLRSVAVLSRFPANPVDYDSTIDITWFDDDTDGLAVGSYGVFSPIKSESTSGVSLGSYGVFIEAVGYAENTSGVRVGSYGKAYVLAVKGNWVKWSDIGNLDFTINKSNVAGERPLDWEGQIYAIKKLGDKVIAYGENGVSILAPIERTYGLNTIYKIGIKSKNAIAGSDRVHFFIDNTGQLFSLGEELKLLDYSEFLSAMTNVVLSWDSENNVLYICDGTYGYVYSPADESLGTCSPLITGVSPQSGILYASASGTIVTPVFEICTDIFDFGTHRNKTIFELEFGTNVTGTLQAAIDYRNNFKSAFTQTSWKDVSTRGNVFITALGREFRVRTKMTSYEYIEMDYITVNGIVHAH
jgi:hypothetical protein